MSLARLDGAATGGDGNGVGVLHRVVTILDAVEAGAHSITEVMESTGYSRSTTHRLLQALEGYELLGYAGSRGYHLGSRLLRLANTAMRELPLRDLAHPALENLSHITGESAQLYVRSMHSRVCIDTAESSNELRTIVPVGAELPLTKGSAAKLFLAWASDTDSARLTADLDQPSRDRLVQQAATAKRRGWADSVGERESGVASVSAPVVGPFDALLAVVSVSGPATRVGRIAAKRYAAAVMQAAREIESALGFSG
ncbi:MAG: IclR family transcriptional regulator [Actinomycetota bacterium]